MNKQEKRPSLFINALSNWAALMINVIVGFLLTPYIIGYLGKNGYGIWILVSSIIGYYGLLDLGISSGIIRYVARYFGQRDYKALNEMVSSAFLIFCAVGLIVVTMSFILARPLSSFFNIKTDQIGNFQLIVLLLALNVGISFNGNLFGVVIKAHERFLAANFVIIIITLIRAGLVVFFLSHGFGLVGIAFSHLTTTIFMTIMNFIICKLLFSHLKIRLMRLHWKTLNTLLAFGTITMIAQIADIMRFHLDSFVIGKWVNIPSVAVYGIAALIIRYFLNFIAQGTQQVCMPRFAAMDGKSERGKLQQLFLKSLTVAAFLSFGIGTLIVIFGQRFIILWVGTDFLEALPVLWILTICYSVALAQATGISLIYALKKHYFLATASIIEGVFNVGLSIYLAPHYGILGVAIGTAVPMLIIKLFVQPIYVSRIIGISLLQYWVRLSPALIIAIGAIITNRYVPKFTFLGNGYFLLVVSVFPYIVVFLLAYGLIQMITKRKRIQETTL